MIPTSLIEQDKTLDEYAIEEDLTYRIDFVNKRIYGTIDDLEAAKQAVIKILATEKFSTPIYSDVYGVEFERLIGKDMDFVKSDLERTVTDALTEDDRIIGISDFKIEEVCIDTLKILFNVNTIYGVTEIESRVMV